MLIGVICFIVCCVQEAKLILLSLKLNVFFQKQQISFYAEKESLASRENKMLTFLICFLLWQLLANKPANTILPFSHPWTLYYCLSKFNFSTYFILFLNNLYILFYQFERHSLEKQRWGESETARDSIFHLLFHSPNGHNDLFRCKLKPAASNSI